MQFKPLDCKIISEKKRKEKRKEKKKLRVAPILKQNYFSYIGYIYCRYRKNNFDLGRLKSLLLQTVQVVPFIHK
jgi:hypothetical protein